MRLRSDVSGHDEAFATGRFDVAALPWRTLPRARFCGCLAEVCKWRYLSGWSLCRIPAKQSAEKKLGDWGLLLSTNKGSTSVVAVTEGSVFSGALQPGDRLTSIGQDTARLISSLRQYLTSRTGDSLFIAIERGGIAETVKVVVPIPPQRPSLTFSRLDDIVYCGINTISDHLAKSLSDSLRSTVSETTKGLIIDLRNCRDDSEGDVEKLARAFLDLQANTALCAVS